MTATPPDAPSQPPRKRPAPLDFSASARLYSRCRSLIPAGVNSNTRARVPHPLYFTRAAGSEIFDLDGNRFTDILMGNGAVLLGHGRPEVQEAVREVLVTGLTTGVESALSCRLAELFHSIVPTMDLVRFTNTGTEACLHALRLARFATGRKRIAKVEGSYHGWSDETFVSVWPDLARAGSVDHIVPLPGSPGQRDDRVAETVVLPLNDIDCSVAAIERHAGELAAVILEPILIDIGFVPATPEYLATLRATCDRHDIVLIFDELLTGFNVAPGGVQQLHGVIPDLATYGKALGNGYPIAALAGRESLMRLLEPGNGPVFVGTFNGHAVSLAAAIASLTLLAGGTAQKTIDERLAQLKQRFHAAAARLGVAAQMCGAGSHFHWYFTAETIRDFRSAATSDARAYRAFVAEIFRHGVLFLPNPLSHHALSLAHDAAVIEHLADVFERGLTAAAQAAAV